MDGGDCFIHDCVFVMNVSIRCAIYYFQNVSFSFFSITVFGLVIVDF